MNTQPRRWFFVVNPVAGNGLVARQWPAAEAVLRAQLGEIQVVFTQYRGHAIELTQQAVCDGYRHIAAVGGDGTNHEAINGLMRQKDAPLADLTYTLLPVGTGNDWIRTHGIPTNLHRWATMARESRNITWQDVGVVEYEDANQQPRQRYFANVAGMAYDGFIVQHAEQHKHLIKGRFMYLALVISGLFRYKLSRAAVTWDGGQAQGCFYTINAGICRYSGGGMQIVPHADPFDGLLALTLAGPLTKLGVLANTWRFYNASIGRHPKVNLYQTHRISVQSLDGAPLHLEADGEFLGYAPATFYLADGKLPVLVPSSP